MFLLDTNVVSELGKPTPDVRMVAWLQAREADCFLSSVTVAEMRFGIERLPEGEKTGGA